MPILIDYYID